MTWADVPGRGRVLICALQALPTAEELHVLGVTGPLRGEVVQRDGTRVTAVLTDGLLDVNVTPDRAAGARFEADIR